MTDPELRADLRQLRADHEAQTRELRESIRDLYGHIHSAIDAVRGELPRATPRASAARVGAIASALIGALSLLGAAFLEVLPALIEQLRAAGAP